jgi:hypothetical protein
MHCPLSIGIIDPPIQQDPARSFAGFYILEALESTLFSVIN